MIKTNGLIALGWVIVWTGHGLTAVHQIMPPHASGATYGWSVPVGIFCLTGFGVLFGYLWGKE